MSEHNNNIRGLDSGTGKLNSAANIHSAVPAASQSGYAAAENEACENSLDIGSIAKELTPGEKLRALREKKNISQAEVAQALYLTVHYVNALEHDWYDKMPGRVFVKGYFRNYATFLGADVDDIVSSYEKRVSAHEAEEEQEPLRPQTRRQPRYQDQSRYLLVGGALVIALFIVLSWWFKGRGGDDSTAVTETYNAEIAASVEAEIARSEEVATAAALLAAAGGQSGQMTQDERITHFIAERSEQRAASQQPVSVGTIAENSPLGTADETADAEAAAKVAIVQEVATTEQDEAVELDVMPEQVALMESRPEPTATAELETLSEEVMTAATTQEVMMLQESQQEPVQEDLDVEPEIMASELLADNQVINLARSGEDLLDIRLNGHSWVEVNDANDDRLFSDLLTQGDELHIQARAPFNILVGDAHQVGIVFNSRKIELGQQIRSDNSARIILTP